jgi:transcriptional regulator with XRE-family HTH domain
MTFHFDIGQSIRAAQKQCSVSNRQMAKDFEVSEMTVQRWRNSEDSTLTKIVRLADYFKMDFESFLELPYTEEV